MIKGRAMGRESKQRVDPAASFDATRPGTSRSVPARGRAMPIGYRDSIDPHDLAYTCGR